MFGAPLTSAAGVDAAGGPGGRAPMVEARGLHARAGAFHLVDVSFSVERGQYVAFMGSTGSGKTTLLETLCGLKRADAGAIFVSGVEITHARPAARGLGYVPQDSALFTTLSVRENLSFSLSVRGRPQAEIRARVEEMSRLLGIGHILDRMPAGLSGGERQRVALGRALANHPPILCLDEPLSALDEELRAGLCRLLARVRWETGVTVLHVTHSRPEAEALADRIITFQGGRILSAVANTPSLRGDTTDVAAPGRGAG